MSRAQGGQLRVWSNLPWCWVRDEVPLNAVAAAVWDSKHKVWKEETGVDCGEAGLRMDKRERERGKLASCIEAEALNSSSRGAGYSLLSAPSKQD